MTTPPDGEWMSAKEALQSLLSLKMNYSDAVSTICTRALAGLIKARANVFIDNDERHSDADVPPQFWWARGEGGLTQNWDVGDFETMAPDFGGQLRAFGVKFRRQDVEQLKPASTTGNPAPPPAPTQRPTRQTVFIGHGRSREWLELEKFLRDSLRLTVLEFNSVSAAGVQTGDRLKEMLAQADFAFLIMSGEDEQATGKFNPRLNVVHEAGLFQGRLGFERAIILREEGCEDFSNVGGLGEIHFPKGDMAQNSRAFAVCLSVKE